MPYLGMILNGVYKEGAVVNIKALIPTVALNILCKKKDAAKKTLKT
jgi:hypothetical protein